MAFPPRFLEELRSRTSLASVVGRRVKLVKKGREYSGLCPFHNEKTPSFTVNEEKGFYHCFGCGAHGDAIAFEMNLGNLSFRDAVERLAAELGMAVPEELPAERERAQKAAGLHEVMEAAAAFFQSKLPGSPALDYLRARGLDDATIARFRLGYSPEGRTALKTALKAKSIPEAQLIEAGLLINPDEGGREPYDRFRGRVMFPITDRRGRVIAFGGRILGDGQPKYLNSPDTPLFHKGEVLYNLAQAREAAGKAGTVIVTEGYMDVIALAKAGFAHAVAPLGTALTERQIEELWKLAPEPILCFDGDAAGQRAAAKAAERALPLLKPGFSLRFATVPAPEDPDSLIKKQGVAAMQAVLDAAVPLFEVLWRMETEGRLLDTPERRAALEADIRTRVQAIADRTVGFQYQSMFRERVRELFFARRPQAARPPSGRGGGRGGFGRAMPFAQDQRLPGVGRPPAPLHAEVLRERILLAAIVAHPYLLEAVGERLGSVTFTDRDLDKLRQEVLKHLGGEAGLDSLVLQDHLRSCGLNQALDAVLSPNVMIHAAFARPDAQPEVARAGWEETFKLYQQKDARDDKLRAAERLASEMSDEAFDYFRAVATQAGAGADDEDGTDHPAGDPLASH